ncbi:MAG: ExeM/NucH family extracellular endonuclease [Aquisalimonadaceae bacterium]
MQGRKRQIPVARILWFSALLLSLAGFLLSGRPAAGACDAAEGVISLAQLAGHRGDAPSIGTPVTAMGTVTGVFPGRQGLNGFFMQQRDGERPAGLFVYAPAFTPSDWARISPGARIRIDARSGEFKGRRQLHRVASVQLCEQGELPAPMPLRLPADREALNGLHGVLVEFPQTLTVTGNYTLGRFGALKLSAGGRLFRHRVPATGQHRIILDDGRYQSDPQPVPYLDEQGTRRAGDRVEALTGILVHAFDDWRVHPLAEPRFEAGNSRRPAPDLPAGLLVATFNLENYFVSLGERGARDAAALERQRSRLLAALEAKNADLLALMEIENRRDVLADLVERLNDRLPEADHYRLLDGPADTGRDAIKSALIYRPRTLEPLGAAQTDIRDVHDRPPVLAAFRNRTSGKRLLAAVVHFKAKSGCPAAGDIDRGQGCWNLRRTRQAQALMDFVRRAADRHGITRMLLAGDFNSYAAEDPIQALEQAGYRNLAAEHLPPERHYTYVFQGEAGMLDYIFASPDLAGDVSGATIWHINADEPSFLSYDGRGGRSAAGANAPWRSSDHDPVIIGLTE